MTRRTRSSRFALQGVYERKETQGTLDTDKGSLSGRYDYLFTDRLFAFGLVDLETDRAEELDLRHTETVGPGYFFIRTDRTELSGEIGIFVYSGVFPGRTPRNQLGRARRRRLGAEDLSIHSLPKSGPTSRSFETPKQIFWPTGN